MARDAAPAASLPTDARISADAPALTPARTKASAVRATLRVFGAALLAASAVNAFWQAMSEARDIVLHSPEPMPAMFAFQFAIGVIATVAAVGIWRRASWSHLAIGAWGIAAAVFVALLELLLKLGADARAGLVGGSVVILAIAAAMAWCARRDQALFVASPVRNRQKRM